MTPTRKAGRPRTKLDERMLEELASINCSYDEMALVLGCSVRTLHDNFRTPIEKGRAQGKSSLKRMQFKLAMDGNATMLIWLGKIWLGQRERREEISIDVKTMTDDQLRRLVAGEDPAAILPDRAKPLAPAVNIYLPHNERDV